VRQQAAVLIEHSHGALIAGSLYGKYAHRLSLY
jgi:hypothetical protein